MILLKNYFAYAIILSALVMNACQQEEIDALTLESPLSRPAPDDFTPIPGPLIIPPSDVIREDFQHAISWTIQWADPEANDWQLNGGFFNIDEGSFHSFNSLNNGDGETLAKVDMNLIGGALSRQIVAPSMYPALGQEENRRTTKFLPSDMSLKVMMSIASGDNPGMLFEEEFENHPNLPWGLQPYDYDGGGIEYLIYEPGEIYIYRTDELNGNPPKYGVIRIIETPSPTTIQVIVPKDEPWLKF